MRRGAKKATEGQSLKQEVRNALLGVLRDNAAPATARASAGRTLYEMFKDEKQNDDGNKPAAEMSLAELDEAIAQHVRKPAK